MTEPAPPRPRLSGRSAALVGLGVFVAALVAFGLVLVALIRTDAPAVPTETSVPSKLPQSARFAKQGDCVLNVGTDQNPDMILVTCTQDALEVIERLEGTVDVKECQKIEGYRYHYFYDSELGDKFDFVLCMRRRNG